ncbi:zinc-binding dehydrogenase [Demequina rhizosphaerae]|uniref:zinc-binding dehydrogenase n=1 Tax=Demequina rhizosphaerae TaxID=1638985 RepID=UPI000783A838|nr:zinc-binding dehydrogenase [Demequina rhizosphaerae]
MKALRLHGPREAVVEEIAEPTVRPGTVKIKVEHAGICGSDLALFEQFMFPNEFVHPLFGCSGPHVLGHEFGGRVVELGEGVDGPAVGTLVAVRANRWCGECEACQAGAGNRCVAWGFTGINGGGGGFSSHVVLNADQVFAFPEELGSQVAAMVESTAVAWHATKRVGDVAGKHALVVGAGPVGLAVVMSLKARGAETIVVSEPGEARRALARQLGATAVDPRETDPVALVKELTAGVGADVSFDASGVGRITFETAVNGLRTGGTAVYVAVAHGEFPVDVNAFVMTEKAFTGSFGYTDEDYAETIEAMRTGAIDPRPLISSVIDLDVIVEDGIEHLLGEGRNSEMKMLVAP